MNGPNFLDCPKTLSLHLKVMTGQKGDHAKNDKVKQNFVSNFKTTLTHVLN